MEEVEIEKNIMQELTKDIYLIIKRFIDIVISLIGCLFIIPLALTIKIIYIFHKDYASIFFFQDRIGKNGKIFKFYKFRTMVPDADEVLKKILAEDIEKTKEYKLNKKLTDDPRITKVGKILRKASIDEVPQLLNILKGDMSLIGNRPYLPREKEEMGIYYNDIVKTTPGLTGYWQVNGRNNTTFKERLELESYYSNNFNLKLDIKIFLKTFIVVIKGIGSK